MKTMTHAKSLKRAAPQDPDTQNTRPVSLSCRAPGAREVFVAGTFNGWNPTATQLSLHMPKGEWRVHFTATPGRHEYKFVVDGQWCCEPGDLDAPNASKECCPNSFGTTNRVLKSTESSVPGSGTPEHFAYADETRCCKRWNMS